MALQGVVTAATVGASLAGSLNTSTLNTLFQRIHGFQPWYVLASNAV